MTYYGNLAGSSNSTKTPAIKSISTSARMETQPLARTGTVDPPIVIPDNKAPAEIYIPSKDGMYCHKSPKYYYSKRPQPAIRQPNYECTVIG